MHVLEIKMETSLGVAFYYDRDEIGICLLRSWWVLASQEAALGRVARPPSEPPQRADADAGGVDELSVVGRLGCASRETYDTMT